jgi:hypothetical protein
LETSIGEFGGALQNRQNLRQRVWCAESAPDSASAANEQHPAGQACRYFFIPRRVTDE